MELTDRQLVKIAENIREHLKVLKNHHYSTAQQMINNISSNMEQLQIVGEVLSKSLYRNWYGATAALISKAQRILRDMPHSIQQAQQTIGACENELPSLRQLYEELNQIQDECGRLEYNAEEDTLSVFTEPIELEEIFLGDFEIKLQISRLAQMQDSNIFRVIALDPNPAAGNDVVTHPHVSEEYLCAGDATVPIQSALCSGRICDFFLLVKAVLETYNSSSPHVPLDEWDGFPCYGCGCTTNEENGFYCESCENCFCDECFAYCRCCDTSICQGCLTSCPICEEPCCEECIQACARCGEPVCASCIENDLCPTCKEEMESQEDENETIEPEKPVKKTGQQVA